jgi:cell division protein FtsI (penicillin-binding protein 3)
VNYKTRPTFIAWRFYLLLSIILIAAAGLVYRVFDLAILDRHFLQREGDERVLRMVSTPAFRGMIVDRNGSPLAISTRVYSLWMNPQEFSPSQKEVRAVAKLLDMPPSKIYALIEKHKKSKHEFVYLKRGQAPSIAAEIKAMHLQGLHTQEEYRRFYPEGEVVAHVVGFTNIDDKGQEGLELAYNDWLAGEPGKKWVIKDRLGRIISDVGVVQTERPGHDLVLSIDRRIQYLAYRELLKGVTENQAQSGSVVVLDAKSGEILAMVNAPSYNPNNRPGNVSQMLRNRAMTDTFEPGSTIKPFSISLALASKKITPQTMIDTTPGWMRVGKNIVKDHQSIGLVSVSEIIQKSSNVGVAKIMLNFSPNAFWQLMNSLGFGESTETAFPGEQNGSLVHHNPWGQFVYATMTFGYGMSANTLQLAHAYTVFANAGKIIPVSFLRVEKAPAGKQVIAPKVVDQIVAMMETVVGKGGTAQIVKVPGYRIAAKTGTSKIAGVGGYKGHHYTSSFVGIAPISNPRVVIVVVINDPQGKQYYGGYVSGPVFSQIMEGALRILDVPPDDLKSE